MSAVAGSCHKKFDFETDCVIRNVTVTPSISSAEEKTHGPGKTFQDFTKASPAFLERQAIDQHLNMAIGRTAHRPHGLLDAKPEKQTETANAVSSELGPLAGLHDRASVYQTTVLDCPRYRRMQQR